LWPPNREDTSGTLSLVSRARRYMARVWRSCKSNCSDIQDGHGAAEKRREEAAEAREAWEAMAEAQREAEAGVSYNRLPDTSWVQLWDPTLECRYYVNVETGVSQVGCDWCRCVFSVVVLSRDYCVAFCGELV
jgi:hypothetical protein